jgi:hypothetical protein
MCALGRTCQRTTTCAAVPALRRDNDSGVGGRLIGLSGRDGACSPKLTSRDAARCRGSDHVPRPIAANQVRASRGLAAGALVGPAGGRPPGPPWLTSGTLERWSLSVSTRRGGASCDDTSDDGFTRVAAGAAVAGGTQKYRTRKQPRGRTASVAPRSGKASRATQGTSSRPAERVCHVVWCCE